MFFFYKKHLSTERALGFFLNRRREPSRTRCTRRSGGAGGRMFVSAAAGRELSQRTH